jgi:hypothetical protein
MVSPLHKAITRFLQLPVLRMALGDGFLSDIYARFGPHTRMAGRQKNEGGASSDIEAPPACVVPDVHMVSGYPAARAGFHFSINR